MSAGPGSGGIVQLAHRAIETLEKTASALEREAVRQSEPTIPLSAIYSPEERRN